MLASIWIVLVLAAPMALAKIVQVQVLARHGLRTPFLPNEINVWDDGGVLSGRGYKQMYDLGDSFHRRYRNSTDWNETTLAAALMARSTDSLTSMMSATSFMTGFLPPGSGPIDDQTGQAALPNGLNPVGIHTVPLPFDIPLRSYDKCPNFLEEVAGVMNSTEMKAFEEKNKALMEKMAKHVSVNVTAPTYLDAYEIIAVEHAFGSLGSDFTENDWNEMKKAADEIGQKTFTGATQVRMVGGRVLAIMAQLVMGAADAHNTTIPFVYLSGQYPTIMAAYEALGVYGRDGIPYELPSPGAMLVVEVHQDGESFAVRSFVHDLERGHDFQEVKLQKCPATPCPVDKFLSIATTSALETPMDWCKLCNNTITPPCNLLSAPPPPPCPLPDEPSESQEIAGEIQNGRSSSNALAILTGIMGGMLIAFFLIAIYRFTKSRLYRERLLPTVQDAWTRRGTPRHVEMQSA